MTPKFNQSDDTILSKKDLCPESSKNDLREGNIIFDSSS